MANKISFRHDSDEDPISESEGSENEFTARDKSLLQNLKSQQQKKKQKSNEVLKFSDDETEEDEDEIIYQSDLEDEDDRISNERAWGSNKRAFYKTGFVDQDYSTYNEQEEELALQEEQEAKAIQMRLAKELNEADFSLDVFINQHEKTYDSLETFLKPDLSNMNHRQKVQLFKKDSPEFEGLVKDFMSRLETSKKYLTPILEYFEKSSLPPHSFFDFVKTKNNLILMYATNVMFYLVLKAKKILIKNHPIVNRLVQMKQLIMKLEHKYDVIIKPQLETLLDAIDEGNSIIVNDVEKPVQRKRLNILQSLESFSDTEEPKEKKVKISITKNTEDTTDSNTEEVPEDIIPQKNEVDENDKRGITYQIAKNKGLTPHRKKENRNPRVKHRNKYKKAVSRRKGAIRTVRKELSKYAGEMSGIKSTVRKSIKIK